MSAISLINFLIKGIQANNKQRINYYLANKDNILKEIELIKIKKSKLSYSQRQKALKDGEILEQIENKMKERQFAKQLSEVKE